jgi:transcription antitermination factor NusG
MTKSENWFVVYTKPNAEKKVEVKVKEMGYEAFLPLHQVVRQWSDRKKKMDVPLFPNYVFVKILSVKRFDLLRIDELIRFIHFDGKPANIAEKDIMIIKSFMQGDVEPTGSDLSIGAKIRVTQGQFAGIEGIMIRKNGRKRLIVNLDFLHKSVSIDIEACQVEASV